VQHTSQVRRNEDDKNDFGNCYSTRLEMIVASEMTVVGGDMNGHVGATANRYEEVHCGQE